MGNAPLFNAAGTGAMSDSNYALGATRNSEKGTVLLFVNLQFSEYPQFGNLVVSTQVVYLIFSEKFEHTKHTDLGTCPEFLKSHTTEILSILKFHSWAEEIFA